MEKRKHQQKQEPRTLMKKELAAFYYQNYLNYEKKTILRVESRRKKGK
jgi:hypothetical protein